MTTSPPTICSLVDYLEGIVEMMRREGNTDCISAGQTLLLVVEWQKDGWVRTDYRIEEEQDESEYC